MAKKINGTTVQQWLYNDLSNPAAELDGSGTVTSVFIGTEYIIRGGAEYRVVKDNLGSPRLLVNVATGAVAQRLDYDEWGMVVTNTAPGWQPLGFGGGIYDSDTGLVRFGARDYDAAVGRWTARDPVLFYGGQSNLYVYARNNPINNLDPDGLTCTFGEQISQAAAVGPLDALTAKDLATDALNTAQSSGLPGARNGQQDAFRHCYWSCRMAQELGADQAEKVGDTHEQCGGGPGDENSMDTGNNEVGRSLASDGNCKDSCVAALNDGDLRTSPGGNKVPNYCPY